LYDQWRGLYQTVRTGDEDQVVLRADRKHASR
jgi:hypothetical protein